MSHICAFLQREAYLTDAPLVLNEATPLTFRQFRDEVFQLARSLEDSLKLPVDSRVALSGSSTLQYFQILLACAWNGWVVVLFNDRWAEKETNHELQLTNPKVLLADHQVGLTLDVPIIDIAGVRPDLVQGVSHKERGMRKAKGDLVVLCFTSGTTSSSKGVMLTHSALLFQSFYKARICEYGSEDVYLHTAPLFHVGGLLSALAMFQVGAKHVFIGHFKAKEVARAILKYKANAIIAVPTMLSDLKFDIYPSIQKILIGGGTINALQREILMRCFPEAKVFTAYGMSECCSSLVYNGPFLARDFPLLPLAAGRPIPGTYLTIHSTTGEILTRGPHLMKGYWDDSNATRNAFEGDWFKTGDVGFIDDQGTLWLQGRIKDMIKSGGENIHPTEIEDILIQHPGIKQVVVKGTPHDRLGEAICVHLVLEEDHHWSQDGSKSGPKSITPNKLIGFCIEKGLSKFRLPRVFCLHETPLEVSLMGKVNRQEIGMSRTNPRSRL